MTDNFEDRITALERKSTQGATLSPVKLWSGDLASNKTFAVTNAEKYKLFMLKSRLWGICSCICMRDSVNGLCDDSGDSAQIAYEVTISGNSFTYKITRNTYGTPRLYEIWGIG